MTPEEMALALSTSRLDVAAITEHLPNTRNGGFARFEEVRSRLQDIPQGNSPLLVLGTEISAIFRGHAYHFGYLFEGDFGGKYWPELPEDNIDLDKLAGPYRRQNPGILLWNHPTWKDFSNPARKPTTQNLFETDCVDGIEIANGSMMLNGEIRMNYNKTREVLRLFGEKSTSRVAPIGTSDAHRPDVVGSALTRFIGAEPADLFQAIRKGMTVAVVTRENLAQALGDLASDWLKFESI